MTNRLAHGSLAIAEPAAAQAGHDILTTLFPAASADFSTALTESLLSYNGMGRTHSIALGTAAAQALLLNRTDDGAATANKPAYVLPSSLTDGDWRPTAPGFKPYQLPDGRGMPLAFLVEAMTQTAGVLDSSGAPTFLAQLRDVRLHRPVLPGDRLTLEARLLQRFGSLHRCDVKAMVGDDMTCQAEIVLSVGGDPP